MSYGVRSILRLIALAQVRKYAEQLSAVFEQHYALLLKREIKEWAIGRRCDPIAALLTGTR